MSDPQTQVLERFEELKGLIERRDGEIAKLGEATAETRQMIDRQNARIDEAELKARRPVLDMARGALETATDPRTARKALESAIEHGIDSLPDEEKALAKRGAFDRYLREGYVGPSREVKALWTPAESHDAETTPEMKAMTLGNDTTGGFLATSEFIADIIKQLVLSSPMRDIATVRTTTKRSVLMPVRTGLVTARWVSETGTRTATDNAYGRVEIPNHEMYALTVISEQDLEDSDFDLEAELRDDTSLQFAVAEGRAFISGTGVGQPEGILTNSKVTSVVSGDATHILASSLITFIYSLPTFYARGARLVMNRKTLGVIRGLTDLQGRFLWEPNYQTGTPPTIQGIPYTEMPDMPDVAAGTYPIALGDFGRAYRVIDRITLVVKRLLELYAVNGEVGFLTRKRVGGQVVLPESVILYKIST